MTVSVAARKRFSHATTAEETEISAGASSPFSMAGSYDWGKVNNVPDVAASESGFLPETSGTGVSALGLRMQAGGPDSHFLLNFFQSER